MLLAVPVMFAIWWALAQSRSTYPLIIPFFTTIAGAVGTLWAIRPDQPAIRGALRFAAVMEAILLTVSFAITMYRSKETMSPDELWGFLFLVPFVGALIATPFGVVFGPILACFHSAFRNRQSPPATYTSVATAVFTGAAGGAIGGYVGRGTELGAFYWGSFVGMVIGSGGVGAFHVSGIDLGLLIL